MSVLSTYGLERLNVVGLDYSHDIAESVGVEKSDKPGGKIIQEIQAGYKLNGKTIRYPKVKVAL
jgi:molecular chaperone GrpE (heat shock protein)